MKPLQKALATGLELRVRTIGDEWHAGLYRGDELQYGGFGRSLEAAIADVLAAAEARGLKGRWW